MNRLFQICLALMLGIVSAAAASGPGNGPFLVPGGGTNSGGGGAGIQTNGGTGISNTFSNATLEAPLTLGAPIIAYVSTSGSDSTGTGSAGNPYATLTNAVSKISGNGTVVITGGSYHWQGMGASIAGCKLRITVPPGQSADIWMTSNAVPAASFSALSNGIFTTAPGIGFSNALCTMTNLFSSDGFHPNGVAILQSNSPYGTQPAGLSDFQPAVVPGQQGLTNRCPVTPLMQAQSVPSLVNSNSYWFFTNGLLYVKFAVSNVAGAIFIPSTNTTDCLVYGGDTNTDLQIEGVHVWGAHTGFNLSSSGRAAMRACLTVASFDSGYRCDSTTNRFVELVEDEGMLSEVEEFFFQTDFSMGDRTVVNLSGCYAHDYMDEGMHFGRNVYAEVANSRCYAGTNGDYGFISAAAMVDLWGCKGYVTYGSSPFQIGLEPFVSYMGLHGCYVQNSANSGGNGGTGIGCTDSNDVVEAWNTVFNTGNTGTAIAIANNPGFQHVETWDCVQANASQANSPLINGAGIGGFPSQFVNHGANFGSDSLVTGGQYVQAGSGQTEGIVANTLIRANNGYEVFNGSTILKVIDSLGDYFGPTGAFGTNGAASGGNVLQVYGKAYIQSNTATSLSLSNFTPGGLNTFYTNASTCRVQANGSVNLFAGGASGASGEGVHCVVNISGVSETVSIGTCAANGATTNQCPDVFSHILGPGDYFEWVQDTSTGTGSKVSFNIVYFDLCN